MCDSRAAHLKIRLRAFDICYSEYDTVHECDEEHGLPWLNR